MINANELMLGSWVNPTFPMQVTYIWEGGIEANFKGNEGDPFTYDNGNIEPIPITSDILNGCRDFAGVEGFDECITNWIEYSTQFEIEWCGSNGEYAYCFHDKHTGKRMKYLHELQLRYYSITGAQLQIEMR